MNPFDKFLLLKDDYHFEDFLCFQKKDLFARIKIYVKFDEEDFSNLAVTLPHTCVSESTRDLDICKKTHESGWTIYGKINYGVYKWINRFQAHHEKFGWVLGDFENKVYFKSYEAFHHFLKHHVPEIWDYKYL
jgi:hypothetical protein